MPRITFIGAGSTVFAKNLLGDILSYPELAESRIVLHDVDEKRLETTEMVARRIVELTGAHPTIRTERNCRAALDGADYAINMIQVGGYQPCTVTDFEIPRRYGLQQTIGDTLGIGGILRGLRTIPVLLDMCAVMEELCPDVLHLNYVNPMAINCWAMRRNSSIQTFGLCHSVQGTAQQLADDIGVPVEEIDYLCAGINHMAFYLRFQRNSEDLYPLIRKVIAEGRVPEWNRVRYEMLERLGYFVTESSEHFSEYVPWFIKHDRPDLIERFNIPLNEYDYRCQAQIRAWEHIEAALKGPGSEAHISLAEMLRDIPVMPGVVEHLQREVEQLDQVTRSHEYAAQIINSHQTGEPCVVYANLPNQGLIDNLPGDCVVEVPCLVDRNGVQPTHVGELPMHLAALMQTNINVQRLTVEAALTGKREHIYHAAMLDPHTAAELDLDQIWSLVDELIAAHGDWLPAFR